jgi:membrane protease subunit (stomatin/prohibitin family)
MSINILERPKNERDLFIYRYPLLDKTVAMGSTIKVGEGEAAVLVKEGKVYDVFSKGEHVLSTAVAPLITKALELKKNDSFTCEVYFVSFFCRAP